MRKAVQSSPPPAGLKVYVTGPTALLDRPAPRGRQERRKVTAITIGVIVVDAAGGLPVDRHCHPDLGHGLHRVGASRGIVAFLGEHDIIGLSTFAVDLLVLLAIAAGTDYAIFLIGRYQEARQAGEDRKAAYYTMFHGTAHVILGSGLTIAGAMYCLSFTRLPYFQSLGVPCAVGMLVAVFAALTLGPAMIVVGVGSGSSTANAGSTRGSGAGSARR